MTKIMNKILLKIFLLFLSIVPNLYGQTFTKPGVTAAQFIKIGISTKGESLGGAVVASVSDVTSTYYNPSGLMGLSGTDFVASYSVMPANLGISFIGIGKRLGVDDVVAISVIGFRSDDMKVRTVLQPLGTGQYFHVADYAVGIHYAHNFTYELKIGFTLRYLYLGMVSGLFTENSWAADMGIQYDTGLKGILEGLKIGMVVSNFGPEIRFVNESYGLPLKYVVGVSKPIKINSENLLNIGIDWVKAIDEKQKAEIGLEYNFGNFFFLRGGYKFASESQNWSGGIGLNKKIIETIFQIDYSYNNFSTLGSMNRFGIEIIF